MFQASLRTSDANEVKVRGIAGALGVKARAPAGKAENDHGDADHPLGFNNDRRAGFDRVCSKIFSGARPVRASYSPTFGSDGSIQSTPSLREGCRALGCFIAGPSPGDLLHSSSDAAPTRGAHHERAGCREQEERGCGHRGGGVLFGPGSPTHLSMDVHSCLKG